MQKLDKNYSQYTDVGDPNFPYGKAIDSSGGGSFDGTPILSNLINSFHGSLSALFYEAFKDITREPSGVPDNIDNSDIRDAVKEIIKQSRSASVKERMITSNTTLSNIDYNYSYVVEGGSEILLTDAFFVLTEIKIKNETEEEVFVKQGTDVVAIIKSNKTVLFQWDGNDWINKDFEALKLVIYERLPHFPEPTHPEMYGMSVGNWINISPLYAAAFKRIEGTNGDHRAVTFGGFQEDAIRNITGEFRALDNSSIAPTYYNTQNTGFCKSGTRDGYTGIAFVHDIHKFGRNLIFDASLVVSTDTDNHPYNMTTQIWVTEWFFRQFLENAWLDAGFELPY
ncbi:MAG: hypothetical protein ACRC4W_06780 [Treponemataceae bacterium]